MQEVRVVRLEPFPDPDDEVVYPRLTERKLEWLEKVMHKKGGERRTFQAGDVLYEHAVRDAPFFVLLSGRVEFVDRKPGKDVHVAAADAGTYIGDIAAFTGEPTISAAVATEETEALVFEREQLREMVAGWPEFGEQIFATLQARRAWHEEKGYGVLRLIAPQSSRRSFEVRDLLERNLFPVHWYDVDTDPESDEMLKWLEIPREETPILLHARTVMRNPSPAQVARELGLRAEVDGQRFDLVVLGAGPAGLAAAVYGGSEGLRTLVVESWAPGGQAGTSSLIRNYLGFSSGVSGGDLAIRAYAQALSFGAEYVYGSQARGVRRDGPDLMVALGGAIGTIAVACHHEIVLGIVGGLFVVEAMSVIIQVFFYKRTGKRVFKMAPIHHHFEQLGWTEPQIVIRFWIISVMLALVGLSTLKLR